MAAENYVITASDLAPAISIDLANRLAGNINALRDLLGITDIQPVPVGSSVKQYKLTVGTLHPQQTEGDVIPLTDVTREAISNITVGLTPYRKSTTIQAIQAVGRDLAINDTDAALVSKIQGTIKDAFYTSLATGSGTVTGATLQTALANAWGAIETYYADIDASPIHFVSVTDVAGYLGSASITLQTAFGMSYIENFLGLGTVVIAPGLDAGEFYSTAKENLRGVYVPATSSDIGQAFGLNADESGLVGITHQQQVDRATIDTLIVTGVAFFPEMADGVFKGTINPS